MREAGIKRLDNVLVSKNRQDYIVMYFLLRDLKSAIIEYGKGNVLDVGCGNKPYQGLFSDKVSSYIGCDVVQSDLNKVDVICEATKLDFADERFDTVFSTQVIEHVQDPFMMLKEIHRVMKMDGNLIVSAPFSWELHEEPYDFFRYSKYGLKSMFESAGFSVVEIVPNGGKWAAIAQLWLNIVYSTFSNKKWYNKVLKGIFINLKLTTLFNSFAVWFDKRNYSDLLTLNYVIVAKKL